MSLPVMDLQVPGLDQSDLSRLRDAGYSTAADLSAANVAEVVHATALPDGKVAAAQHAARQSLGEHLMHLTPRLPDPPNPRPIGRALDAARRLQRTTDVVRQARRRVKDASGGGRRRCRKLLKALVAALQLLEHDLLTAGASSDLDQDLRFLLDDIDDRMQSAVIRHAVKARHVRRLRTEAEGALLRVEALRLTALSPVG